MMLLGSKEQQLMLTGFSLGLLHVLAGPDHLSALAALSVGTSYKAFTLGVRWGIGHSTGLVVVAIIFIALKGDLDLHALGRYCNAIVGAFMICLGCYGVISAIKTHREKRKKRDPDLNASCKPLLGSSNINTSTTNLAVLESGIPTSSTEVDSPPSSIQLKKKRNNVTADGFITESSGSSKQISALTENRLSSSEQNERNPEIIYSEVEKHFHHDAYVEECPWCPFINMHDPYTQRILSFSIGLLHGVAGPGGILGVLPAVEMQRWTSSVLYLGSFIFASTLSMGTFAALYGEATKRIGATTETAELGLSIFSAGISILVGVIWFVLSILGKLGELFE